MKLVEACSLPVSVEPRGDLAGGPGETGPINQAPPHAKTDGQGTTENNGAQDTIKSLELARQTLADAGQAGPAELIQQQIGPLKEKAKESDKGTANSSLSKIKSLRWKRVKLVKQIARSKDEEPNLRKKAAEALEQAENAKSRYEQFHVELAKVDAEEADACVAVQSEGVQATSGTTVPSNRNPSAQIFRAAERRIGRVRAACGSQRRDPGPGGQTGFFCPSSGSCWWY